MFVVICMRITNMGLCVIMDIYPYQLPKLYLMRWIRHESEDMWDFL